MGIRQIKRGLRKIDARAVKPKTKPKVADGFYVSAAWRSLIACVIAERGRRCEAPGCGRSDTRIFGDHIVELKDGGAPLDRQNIRLLCGSCHTRKTMQMRAARLSRHP